ncbi:MAG: TRAP transporter substrate-binding protein DctP [Minisyncoccia bacterium]
MAKPSAIAYLVALTAGTLFLFFAFSGTTSTAQSNSELVRVRWLLAHEPADVYVRSITILANELRRESDGSMVLETVTPSDIGIANPTHTEILAALERGDVELSSTYGVANGFDDERFWVWQFPFLFNSYAEVEAAFTSSEGEALLVGLDQQTSIRPLAYTLSGGFRILASSRKINSVDDLHGLRIATVGGPVAEAVWQSVGAVPISLGAEDSIDTIGVDAVETTYARLASVVAARPEYARHLAETNHSLFLTTIVASDAFYNSLTPDQQQALSRAVRTAAAAERADAIDLNEKTKADLIAGGTIVTEFSVADRVAFVRATESVYDLFKAIAPDNVRSGLQGR